MLRSPPASRWGPSVTCKGTGRRSATGIVNCAVSRDGACAGRWEKKKPTKQPHSRLCRPLGLWPAPPPAPGTHPAPTSIPLRNRSRCSGGSGSRRPAPGRAAEPHRPSGPPRGRLPEPLGADATGEEPPFPPPRSPGCFLPPTSHRSPAAAARPCPAPTHLTLSCKPRACFGVSSP